MKDCRFIQSSYKFGDNIISISGVVFWEPDLCLTLERLRGRRIRIITTHPLA
jgi:hypothetical protein